MRRSIALTAAAVVTLLLAAGPAHASTIYLATLAGGNENPPNDSTAIGLSMLVLDGNQLSVDVLWSGLTGGPAAAAHIHCCVPIGTNTGVAIPFTGFPAMVSGVYSHVFDLLDATVYTPGFLAASGGGTAMGARDALVVGLNAGLAYSNIHDAMFPAGEIRGQLSAVPEPASLLLLGSGLAAGAWRRRSRPCA